jgi:hypothetical protein
MLQPFVNPAKQQNCTDFSNMLVLMRQLLPTEDGMHDKKSGLSVCGSIECGLPKVSGRSRNTRRRVHKDLVNAGKRELLVVHDLC